MRLNHIAIIASTEASINFYGKLGFQTTECIKRENDEIVFMFGNDLTLEIFIDASHPVRLDKPEAIGLRHLAFDVDNFDDMLQRFECEPVRNSFDGVRFTFTKDPDGVPIELREHISKTN